MNAPSQDRAWFKNIGEYMVPPLLIAVALLLFQTRTLAAGETNQAGLVLTVEGSVEIARLGEAQWNPAAPNAVLGFGDSLRTAPQSRATVRLSDLSVIRVNEKTVLEVREQSDGQGSEIGVRSGSTYFFNRAKPSTVHFHTPLISGAIRGTEFNLAVDGTGRTTVALIDGEVGLKNSQGELVLQSGEQGIVEPGQAPRKTAMLNAINIIQWSLYYPAVLDPDELDLTVDEKSTQAGSLAAYRSGDLLVALAKYPVDRAPASDGDRVQRAALLLAVGQVEQTQAALKSLPPFSPAVQALREVIAAVKHEEFSRGNAPATAGEWLAESYYLQSRSRLNDALKAAREATGKSTNFGFAWVRVAELEFGMGRVNAAESALERGLQLSPRNAQALTLKGFLLAAGNHTKAAADYLNQAIVVDGALANAWLGRGLCAIREGHYEAGRQDLQVAAALEPNRAELRNYLGKAWVQTHDRKHAEKELRLAKQLDPNDPTPWLYSALLNYDYNRNNEAIADLEKSKELNDNRSVFRSKLLLDQDQAVRGANLAKMYQDTGMTDVSVRESTQAVDNDYGNYSAHLFLANSYDALRDPKHLNLRYETPWFSQLLVADLLAPVGALSLSQNVSQQEYSRLFAGDEAGVYSDTRYSSHGDWVQNASQYGNYGNTGFAFDEYYRNENGFRPNNDLQDFSFTAKFKQQLTAEDSLFFETAIENFHSGDVMQYYSQNEASRTLRVTEVQEPNLYLGYHREWAPGIHILALVGRLQDKLTLDDPASITHLATTTPAGVMTGLATPQFPFTYTSELVAYSAELQQIFQTDVQTLVLGARYQTGRLNDYSTLTDTLQLVPPAFTPLAFDQNINPNLNRVTGYGYYSYRVAKSLLLTAGLSYDHLEYPENDELPPVSAEQKEKDQVSPKAGFRWTPFEKTTFRGAWTRSLGGVFYDTSVRLEPTEIAGFNQAFRSVLPESVAGLVPGSRFETFDVAFDQEFPTHTYVSVVAELLNSSGSRGVGYLTHSGPFTTTSAGLDENLRDQDRSLTFVVNQLLDDEFAVGASYRIDAVRLDDSIPAVPYAFSSAFSSSANRTVKATLNQASLYALFNHRCGFFSKVEGVWYGQSNSGYSVDLPGDDFIQVNAFAGYRLPRRQAELQVGVLNIGNRDYQLNPLNLYAELPRQRTFVTEVKFTF